MLKKQLLLLLALLCFGTLLRAQAPQKMTFQSVIRNSSGALVVSSPVGIQISILHDSATGPAVYIERQLPTTNANGLATILIGTGSVVWGSFDSIHWDDGPWYLYAQTDPTGGSTYSISATQQLVTVPYAFYANYAQHSGDTNSGTKPTVTTDSVNTISYTSANVFGNVTTDGGELVLFRGACVDTVSMPDISSAFASPGNGVGMYHVSVPGLMPNTLYHIRAFATNSNGTSYGDTTSFMTLTLTTATVLSDTISGISTASATGGGTVTGDGGSPVTDRGMCWNTTGSPTLTDAHISGGTGIGHFYVTLSPLTPTTTYYARAYATNALGTTYGAQDSFTTVVYSYATIATDTITPISYTWANSGVDVISDGGSGISSQGVCWGTTVNPTTSGPHTGTSTGIGDYPVTITGLTPATTYYVRAYCHNGTGLVYGPERIFTTYSPTLPNVATNSVIGITAATATCGGHITDGGGSPVTARGVCWSLGGTPTIDSSHTTDGSDTGLYNSNITGLAPLTTYYVCAYATNGSGTAYGAVISFTTDSFVTIIPAVPNVGTTDVNILTGTTASSGGYVLTSPGSSVTARGVCWNTTGAPTIADAHTTDGTGLGYFSSSITGLSGCSVHLYVRGYATNATGTGYGNQIFDSTGLPPVFTEAAVTSITATTAVSGGNITSDGGCTVTQRGVVWCPAVDSVYYDSSGGNYYPLLEDGRSGYTSDGTGTGIFVSTLTGLYPGVLYMCRSYVLTGLGVFYGPLQLFTSGVPTTGHYIGENFAGGLVFYIDSTGNHGYVIDPYDLLFSNWGCIWTNISGTNDSFGHGAINTSAIIASCTDTTSAAYRAATCNVGGYSDWFLPNYSEFDTMYVHFAPLGFAGYGSSINAEYWLSTQTDPSSAETAQPNELGDAQLWGDTKDVGKNVRAIRHF